MIRFGWYAVPLLGGEPPPGTTVDVPVEPVAVVTIPLGMVEGLVRVLTAQRDAAAGAQSLSGGEPAVGARAETDAL